MIERIKVIDHEGKIIFYFDLSNLQNNDDITEFVNVAKAEILKYEACKNMHSITNIEGMTYDTKTKEIVAEWMKFNNDYFEYGFITGHDGIKRMILKSIFKMAERNNIKFINKEDAIKLLTK